MINNRWTFITLFYIYMKIAGTAEK